MARVRKQYKEIICKSKEGLQMKFEDYFNIYKKQISNLCISLCTECCNKRIEHDDLFQMASICLLGIFNKNYDGIISERYVLKSVRRYLKKHISSELGKPLMNAVSDDNLIYGIYDDK